MTTDAPRHPEHPNLHLFTTLAIEPASPDDTPTITLATYYDPQHHTPRDLASKLREYADALDDHANA